MFWAFTLYLYNHKTAFAEQVIMVFIKTTWYQFTWESCCWNPLNRGAYLPIVHYNKNITNQRKVVCYRIYFDLQTYTTAITAAQVA